MEEHILTRHPEGKQGVRIEKRKYDTIRNQIALVLKRSPGLTFTELAEQIERELRGRFDGSVFWVTEVVKLDLEAGGTLRRQKNGRRVEYVLGASKPISSSTPTRTRKTVSSRAR